MTYRKRAPLPIASCFLAAVILLMTPAASLWGAENGVGGEEEVPAATPAPPSLGEVVYRAGTLSQQLATLKEKITALEDLEPLTQTFAQAGKQLDRYTDRLAAMNTDDLQSYQQLATLMSDLRKTEERVGQAEASLSKTMVAVENWRHWWVDEKLRWQRWRTQLEEDSSLASVARAISRARTDIGEALDLVSAKLEPMLDAQQKAGDIHARIESLKERIDEAMIRQRGGTLRGGTPTIISIAYLRQIIDLMHEPGKIVKPLLLPDRDFFSANGWIIALQVVLFVILLTLLRHYRRKLAGQVGRRFLGKRPVSVALLVPIFTLSFFYGAMPSLWRLLIQSLAGVATARLLTNFVAAGWIRRAVYVLVAVMIAFQILLLLGIPLALVRLFILLWTTAGMIYFGWRIRRRATADLPVWQAWLLRLVTLVFIMIVVTDVIGMGGLSAQLMDSALRTAMLLLMGWAMMRLARAALELAAESIPMDGLDFLRKHAREILSRVIFVCNALIIFFVTANLLVAWKLYAIPGDAINDILAFGFPLGSHTITLSLLLVAGAILYGAFVLSWSLQGFLMDTVFTRGQMDTGARLSIVRLVHYALICVGFLFALSAMGFELKNITIIGGALGVGIGFGMQNIVNNFVSGLILLFERPIKVGDVIQLGSGQQGRVTNLGLRATTVQTFDRAEIVVPNGDLISSQVTNWTLKDRSMRLTIPVGVAYGSDVETVMRVLMAVATENDKVLKDPQPMVLFLNFGDSSLDFQLRVWISDFGERRIIQSALIREVDRRFREERVEIPFPQRDLHLRSVDGQAAKELQGASGEAADRTPPTEVEPS